MVTSIFAGHGIYVGPIESHHNHGYQTFEHVNIREEVNRIAIPHPVTRVKSLQGGATQQHVRRIFDRYMPTDRRWVYKSGVTHFPIFEGMYDDMRHVFVRRNVESVIESNLAKGHGHPDKTRAIVERYTEQTDELGKRFPIVLTDEVVAGDYSSLEGGFDYCGVDFDESVAKRFIDPSKWRF